MGSVTDTFEKVKEALAQNGIHITNQSSLYKTSAWGVEDQPDFLNQVIQIRTNLEAEELLNLLLFIEKDLGRKRKKKWGPRIIDIDILYYDQQIIDTTDLKVPHPEILNRRFTIEPLAEIAPEFVHPNHKKSQLELLASCKDTLPVEKL